MRNFVITVNGKAYQVGVEEVGATASYVTPVAPVADAQPAAPVFPVGKSAAPSVAGETPAATPYPAADAATTGAVNETPRATGLETPNLDAPKPKKKKTGLIVGLIIAALAIAGIAFEHRFLVTASSLDCFFSRLLHRNKGLFHYEYRSIPQRYIVELILIRKPTSLIN